MHESGPPAKQTGKEPIDVRRLKLLHDSADQSLKETKSKEDNTSSQSSDETPRHKVINHDSSELDEEEED